MGPCVMEVWEGGKKKSLTEQGRSVWTEGHQALPEGDPGFLSSYLQAGSHWTEPL